MALKALTGKQRAELHAGAVSAGQPQGWAEKPKTRGLATRSSSLGNTGAAGVDSLPAPRFGVCKRSCAASLGNTGRLGNACGSVLGDTLWLSQVNIRLRYVARKVGCWHAQC